MEVVLPDKFQFLFEPYRYKAAYGGRGSAKSHSFATALVVKAAQSKLRILCCRETQKSIKDSSKRLIDDKIKECGLESFFESTETEIRGKNGSLFLFAGLKTNPEGIKSMEGIDIAWVEEADRVSQRSLDLLIPTIRKENSELWFTWNPNDELDAVDRMFRGPNPPQNSFVQQVNYVDNPFFPSVLEDEAERDRVNDFAKYQHVWLGDYRGVEKGAYYAKQITEAIQGQRIGYLPHDPNAEVYMALDLGMADLTTIWFYQLIRNEIHFIDYYQSQYTSASDDAVIISKKPYKFATMWLPHDAKAKQKGTGKSTEEVYKNLGFNTKICPMVSVKQGIDAARDMFPRCWFDSVKCEDGLKALKAYHEDYNDDLKIGKGPLHDWSSHASDAFRYCAVSMSSIHAANSPTPPQEIAKAVDNMMRRRNNGLATFKLKF